MIKTITTRSLALFLCAWMTLGPQTLLAANYQWIQTDWSGGGDLNNTTGHNPAQNGQTQWNRYYSKDPNILTPTGEISLSPLSSSWTQSTDADFQSGTLTNLHIVNTGDAASLTLNSYLLDRGTGTSGSLVVDGTTAGNSTDGQAHGTNNPLIINGTQNYTQVTIQNGGTLSVTPAALLSPPANVTITITSGINGPDGVFYYTVTAIDRFGFETSRSPLLDDPFDNRANITGNFAPRIQWNAVAGAAGYRVYRKTDPTSNYISSPYQSPAIVCSINNPATTSCLDTFPTLQPGSPHLKSVPTLSASVSATGGSVPDGTYYYGITAVDYWGFETTRGTQSAVTVATGTGTASIPLTWSLNGEATGYRVYRSTQSGIFNDPSLICATTGSSCVDILSAPLPGTPPRSYTHAVSNGGGHLKVQGTLAVDATSSMNLNGKGFPGGINTTSTSQGNPGTGTGGGGNRGGGAGFGTAGSSNNNPSFPAEIGVRNGSPISTLLYPGSGGAAGSFLSTSRQGGVGGTGGGFLRISADTISLSGILTLNGTPGQDVNITATDPGGGGSGGLLFLESNTLVNDGQITAIGGRGGIFTGTGGSVPSYYNTAGTGGSGRIRISTAFPWSGNGSIDPAPFVGNMGIYESPSQDLGAGGVKFTSHSLAWTGPLNGGTFKFLIATNNDNQTWIYRGPDGTLEDSANPTYYTVSGTPIFSGHDGDRYIRYKVIFEAPDIQSSPSLESVTVGYEYNPAVQSIISSPFDSAETTNALRRVTWDENLPSPGNMGSHFQMRTSGNLTNLLTTAWKGPFDTTLTTASIPLQNPGFESCTQAFTVPPGWTASGMTTTSGCFSSGHSGSWSARQTGARYFYQAFQLSAGVNYIFSVWAKVDNPLQTATLRVSSLPNGGTIYCSNVTQATVFTQINCSYTPSTDLTAYLTLLSGSNIAYMAWFDDVFASVSSTIGLDIISVEDAGGFAVDDRITLTDQTNPAQEELRRITAIDTANNRITLDAPLTYGHLNGSMVTNLYSNAQGGETINATQRDGVSDQWFQYRVFLTTQDRLQTPVLRESRIGYLQAAGVYQPDGIIDGDGNDLYGAAGSGGGGRSLNKPVDPGFVGGEADYSVRIQNDGTLASGPDTYILSLNPSSISDTSGSWNVLLNNGSQDLPFPVSFSLTPGTFQDFTLKAFPSSHAPADSLQTVTLDIHSENEYNKVDSIQAAAMVNRVYQADGVLGVVNPDGSISGETGDGPPYDPGQIGHDPSGQGNGGTVSLSAAPGETVRFSLKIENEGNIQDRYTLSQNTTCVDSNDPGLIRPLPPGWKIFINDGTKDYDMTSSSSTIDLPQPATQYIPATLDPTNISFQRYTLKVLSVGEPVTCDTIVNIRSIGTNGNLDSVKAVTVLAPTHKIDLWIEGRNGDNLYGDLATGGGGSYSKGIPGGILGTFDIGVQNEGNVADAFELTWNIPSGWSTTILHQDGSVLCNGSPCVVPPSDKTCPYFTDNNGNNQFDPNVDQCLAIAGEVIPLRLQVRPPVTFTSGDQSLIIDGKSRADSAKVDSIQARVWANALNIAVSSVTATSATVTWTAPSWSANAYDLRYSAKEIIEDGLIPGPNQVNFSKAISARGLSKPNSAGSPESFTITQLYANTAYDFALKTKVDASYTSVKSICTNCPATTSVSTDATPPPAVNDLAVTTSTADSVTLCWTAPVDDTPGNPVTGYLLKYSTRSIVDNSATPGMGEIRFNDAAAADGLGVPKSPGTQECYRVSVKNLISGNDRTPNSRFFFNLISEDENHNLSPMSNVASGMTSLTSAVYNMVSVPKVPNPDTPTAVFGDDVGSPLYLYQWDSRGVGHHRGCYDGLPSAYNPNNEVPACTQISSISEGKGYFLWSPRLDIALDAPAGSADVTAISCTGELGQNFLCDILPLEEGWNMIGNPFGKEVDLSAVKVRRTVQPPGQNPVMTTLTFQEAVTAGWIGTGGIYTYNGTSYTYDVCDAVTCIPALQPWKGYWIWIGISDVNTLYDLMIPSP